MSNAQMEMNTSTLYFAYLRGAHLTQEEQDKLMMSMSTGNWATLKANREIGLQSRNGAHDPSKIHWTEACAFPNQERFLLIDASGTAWHVDPLKGTIRKMHYLNEEEVSTYIKAVS